MMIKPEDPQNRRADGYGRARKGTRKTVHATRRRVPIRALCGLATPDMVRASTREEVTCLLCQMVVERERAWG